MNLKQTAIMILMTTITAASDAGTDPRLKTPAAGIDFPALPYAYDALEPYIDKMTMEIHYSKHYRAYYDNFLKAIAGTDVAGMSLGDVFASTSKFAPAIRNNGGGYYNHLLFWENLAPAGTSTISADFEKELAAAFGSFTEFKIKFSDAGKGRFGSGWAWLCVDPEGKLFITSTPNQDNPLMDVADKKGIPLLGLDVWEHAYYLKYQNRRPDYIDAFWNLVNWKTVEARYNAAKR